MDALFEQHVEQTYKSSYYFALSLTKNDADAADLTQQAYLKLTNNWKKLRDKSKVKSWLFSTMYREFLDRCRRKKFHATVDFDTVGEHLIDETAVPNNLDYETIISALMNLEEKLRLPLTLFYLEDYTYREISEILMVPIGTVMSRMHRGKTSLYDQLTRTPAPRQQLHVS